MWSGGAYTYDNNYNDDTRWTIYDCIGSLAYPNKPNTLPFAADSKKLCIGAQSGKKTHQWDSDAILQGSLGNVPIAPSNVVKIYVLSTKSGKIFSVTWIVRPFTAKMYPQYSCVQEKRFWVDYCIKQTTLQVPLFVRRFWVGKEAFVGWSFTWTTAAFSGLWSGYCPGGRAPRIRGGCNLRQTLLRQAAWRYWQIVTIWHWPIFPGKW